MIDIRTAAVLTETLIERSIALYSNADYGKDHLHEMCQKIASGEVSGEKAHRWLGWAQAAICIYQGATLEQFKRINKDGML